MSITTRRGVPTSRKPKYRVSTSSKPRCRGPISGKPTSSRTWARFLRVRQMSEQAAASARKNVVSRRRAGQLSARKNVVSRRRVPASRSAVGQEECGQQTPCRSAVGQEECGQQTPCSGKQVSCREECGQQTPCRSAVGQEECGQQTPCSGKQVSCRPGRMWSADAVQVSCRPGRMWSADAVFRQAGQLSGPRLQTTRWTTCRTSTRHSFTLLSVFIFHVCNLSSVLSMLSVHTILEICKAPTLRLKEVIVSISTPSVCCPSPLPPPPTYPSVVHLHPPPSVCCPSSPPTYPSVVRLHPPPPHTHTPIRLCPSSSVFIPPPPPPPSVVHLQPGLLSVWCPSSHTLTPPTVVRLQPTPTPTPRVVRFIHPTPTTCVLSASWRHVVLLWAAQLLAGLLMCRPSPTQAQAPEAGSTRLLGPSTTGRRPGNAVRVPVLSNGVTRLSAFTWHWLHSRWVVWSPTCRPVHVSEIGLVVPSD